jgi:hypothetical protein
VLRILKPKRENVPEGWRKLCNDKLHNLYSLLNIIRVNKSRRVRLAGHVAYMGSTGNSYKILIRKPGRKDHLGDKGIDGKTVLLKWILFRIHLAQGKDQWRLF